MGGGMLGTEIDGEISKGWETGQAYGFRSRTFDTLVAIDIERLHTG
jgi:hypothetical protein